MTELKPGSILWLLRHELRLSWRAPRRSRSQRWLLIFLLIVAAGFMSWPSAMVARHLDLTLKPGLVLGLDLAALGLFAIMTSQSLITASLIFEQRGDLDLLLSSPLQPRAILAARGLNVAASSLALFLFLATPVVLPLALAGHWALLGVYPVLLALALLAAALGLALTVTLSATIRPKMARIVGQVFAGVLGLAVYLIGQSTLIFPRFGRNLGLGVKAMLEAGRFGPGAPLAYPARALLGDPLAWAPLLILALLVFAGSTALLGPRFARLAAIGPKPGRPRRPRPGRTDAQAFGRTGAQSMILKEFKLLLRDPGLLSQILLRVLGFLPLMVLLARTANRQGYGPGYAAGAISFMAAQLAGSLTWLTISAEDAPDLLASSPMPAASIRRAKLAAALLPVAALAALPLLALGVTSVAGGLIGALATLASAGSASLIGLWYQKPAARSAFRRRGQGQVLVAVAEILIAMGWWAAATVTIRAPAWGLVPAVLTLLAVGGLKAVAEPDRL